MFHYSLNIVQKVVCDYKLCIHIKDIYEPVTLANEAELGFWTNIL